MDAHTLLTALLTAALVSAAMGYFAKEFIRRHIDLQVEKIAARSSTFAERAEREASIHDQQVEALEKMLALAIRLRDSARHLSSKHEEDWSREIVEGFHGEVSEFGRLCFGDWSLFYTQRLRPVVHTIRGRQSTVLMALDFARDCPDHEDERHRRVIAVLRRNAALLEADYGDLLDLIHIQLAVREYATTLRHVPPREHR